MVQFNEPLFASLSLGAFFFALFLSWLVSRHQKNLLRRWGREETLRKHSRFGWRRRDVLLLASLVTLAFLTAAGPYASEGNTGTIGYTLNAVFVVDVSESMRAEDTPEGISRIALAVRSAEAVMEAYPDGCFGLVLFARTATGWMTCDQKAVHALLEEAAREGAARSPGSFVEVGLPEAQRVIAALPVPTRLVILLSDGGGYIFAGQIDRAAANLRQEKVRVVAGGLGDYRPARIPVRDPKTGEITGYHRLPDRSQALTRLEEAPLMVIAAETGGTYQRVLEGDEIVNIIRQSGWDDYPVKGEEERSLIAYPLSAFLFLLLVFLIERRLTG